MFLGFDFGYQKEKHNVNWKCVECEIDGNTWYDAPQLGSGHILWRQDSKYRQWLKPKHLLLVSKGHIGCLCMFQPTDYKLYITLQLVSK